MQERQTIKKSLTFTVVPDGLFRCLNRIRIIALFVQRFYLLKHLSRKRILGDLQRQLFLPPALQQILIGLSDLLKPLRIFLRRKLTHKLKIRPLDFLCVRPPLSVPVPHSHSSLSPLPPLSTKNFH